VYPHSSFAHFPCTYACTHSRIWWLLAFCLLLLLRPQPSSKQVRALPKSLQWLGKGIAEVSARASLYGPGVPREIDQDDKAARIDRLVRVRVKKCRNGAAPTATCIFIYFLRMQTMKGVFLCVTTGGYFMGVAIGSGHCFMRCLRL